jgi:hypothetical protein
MNLMTDGTLAMFLGQLRQLSCGARKLAGEAGAGA